MVKTISSTKCTLKIVEKEDEYLVLLIVFERANEPEWGAPSFVQLKTKQIG